MKRTIVALALFLAAGTAAAQEAGPYLGLSAGTSTAGNACDGIPAGVTCDDQTTTFKVFGGYQFNRNIALEVGYTDRLAKAEASGFGINADVTSRALELVAIPAYPLSESVSVYGKLGVYSATTTAKSNIGFSAEDSNTNFTYGLGLSWRFNRNLSARVDYQRYAKVGGDNVGEADVDTLNIGLAYHF